MIPLETPLSALPGTQRFAPKLKKLHIETVRDLLWHFPIRYEDFSETRAISDLEPGESVTVQGVIEDVSARRIMRRNMTIVEAIIADDTGTIRAVWFNQPYLKDALRPGRLANFSGKISISEDGELYLSHPTHEFVAPGAEAHTKHTARLVPVYGETKGLTSKGLRFMVEPLLGHIAAEEWLPQSILESHRFMELRDALRTVHFPSRPEEAEAARRRFAFEELFLLQLAIQREKAKIIRTPSEAIPTDIEWLKGILEKLPFELTQSQKQSLWEVIKDMDRPHPMNRLLQGDVGSGKTVIAALAAVIAAKRGIQTAFMAPTEILARQHFDTIKKLFAALPEADQPAIGLLAAGEAKVFYENDLEGSLSKKAFLANLKKGDILVAVGTHALIQKGVGWNKLGLAIVDEQHRFGVAQRAALLAQKPSPHYLSMSATPIPRTLMLTVFGDLDTSRITELPSGRKAIKTDIVPPGERERTYEFIRKEIKAGRQAFVICPRIDVSDATPEEIANMGPRELSALEVKSATAEFERLQKTVFPELKVAMLHGRMKPAEKEAVMRAFKEGRTHILVSTSVVEVGVDVPNATVMMIESSDRFGLAQLYQFRGRVGRGAHQSYCFLMTDSDAKTANERLKALVAAKNGFDLAEHDLRLRGPGEFLGESQTGLPDVAMESLRNPALVDETRAAAEELGKTDPALKKNPALAKKLTEFRKRIHRE